MSFSSIELERYARHIVIPEIGGSGQQKLSSSRVLVIGVGGLGCPILQYLVSGGIGTLRFVDDDIVSLSNLQRQVLFGTDSIGEKKVDCASGFLERLNPHCVLEPMAVRFASDTAMELLSDCDLVLDATDNFETRHLIADSCELHRIPLISSSVRRFDGAITTLKPWVLSPDGLLSPRYRDIFPLSSSGDDSAVCSEVGILGCLCGLMGSLQAFEAIKELLGLGEGLVGRLLWVDGLSLRFQVVMYGRG